MPASNLSCCSRTLFSALIGLLLTLSLGCSDDSDAIRSIQVKRQERMQTENKQDHLGEAFSLLSRIVQLNAEKAQRQIVYHLNQWSQTRPEVEGQSSPAILRTIDDVLPSETLAQRVQQDSFIGSDVTYLRDCYLFRQIVEWINTEQRDDILLAEWMEQQANELGDQAVDQLRTASRLFDWTVRNIAFEPLQEVGPGPPAPSLPLGMKFRGPGYRQSDYLTVWRGTGDAWQRAGVFTQLCRQAKLRAAVLATQSSDTGELTPWCVGVLIGDNVYLFEPGLGTHVPGPDQVGIATLAQARQDAAVVRRLGVPGFFDYPLSKGDVQQCIALFNLLPEAVSLRMKKLQAGLTGDRRMNTYVDVEELAQEFDDASGIGGARLWKVPLLAEVYRMEMEHNAERDPMFQFWYKSRWAIMDAAIESSQNLALGRWRHLTGQFDDDDEEAITGARSLYLTQRAPEFEIADLDIDVNLQKAYGIRRELRTSPEVYNMQIRQVQGIMRFGKRTASYWLSLLQYDDARMETAHSWFTKRVLVKEQASAWEPAARYNLSRTLERIGKTEEAIELYKTVGDPQEHGNRIRARLLAKYTGS